MRHHELQSREENGQFGTYKPAKEIHEIGYQKGWADGYAAATALWTAKLAAEAARLSGRGVAIGVAMSARTLGWTVQQMWDAIRRGSAKKGR